MPISRVTLKGLELLEVLADEGDDMIHRGSMGDLSSLTRDSTHAFCSGSSESYPLGHQGRPTILF